MLTDDIEVWGVRKCQDNRDEDISYLLETQCTNLCPAGLPQSGLVRLGWLGVGEAKGGWQVCVEALIRGGAG